MKTVILAGGKGTRLSEETEMKPKPMVEIGGKPIIWHIMKIYAHYGITDFIICCGYKSYIIKEYFANYFLHSSDVTVDLQANSILVHKKRAEPWKVTLVDTGEDTMTGGRLLKVKKYIKDEKLFCFTYGDGVSNINISDLISFHKSHGKLATLTATAPVGRYGSLSMKDNKVIEFREKHNNDTGFINGGFFVFSPKILDSIENFYSSLETQTLQKLTKNDQLMAFKHTGFWHAMDTLRDKKLLDELCSKNKAPWMVWEKK